MDASSSSNDNDSEGSISFLSHDIESDDDDKDVDDTDDDDSDDESNDESVVGSKNIPPDCAATPRTPTDNRQNIAGVTPTPNVSKSVRISKTPDRLFLGRKHVADSDVESETTDKKTKQKNNNTKKRTSRIIDLNNIPEINIVIPLKSLISLIKTQFICKKCRKSITPMEFEVETFGVAHSLHTRCECGHHASGRSYVRQEAQHKISKLKSGQPCANRVSAMDFEINTKLLLGIQLGGRGRQEMKNIMGMLNIANNPMARKVTELREEIGNHILDISAEILKENLHLEKELSPTESDGKKLLSVSNDARWDKRSAGRRYDSPSGCSVMLGNRTKLVIGLEMMSTQCIKCSNDIPHIFSNCLHNYDGSAKGMESTGASALVKRITNEENGCTIQEYVSDDNSSSRAILMHSIRELVLLGVLDKNDRPKYKSGKIKPTVGELSLDHPPITFLADKGHRVRIYARIFFKWAYASGSKGFGVTNIDAERMKRRMSWTLRLFAGGTFEEFKTAVEAMLEHHFDNHTLCGDWCLAKGKVGEEKEKHGLKFRCKTINKEMYEQFKIVHETFMEETSLRQLFHEWDTNAVEGFNMLITKFLPKNRQYATTIENKVRIHLAMCLLSIGYERFFRRLYNRCGLTRGEFCLSFVKSEDRDRQWRKQYRKLKSTKINRMRNFYRRLKDAKEKEVRDKTKGKEYKSGLMAAGGEREELSNTNVATCKHCGKIGHSRKSHSDCVTRI